MQIYALSGNQAPQSSELKPLFFSFGHREVSSAQNLSRNPKESMDNFTRSFDVSSCAKDMRIHAFRANKRVPVATERTLNMLISHLCVNLHFNSFAYNIFVLYVRIKIKTVLKTTRFPLSFHV